MEIINAINLDLLEIIKEYGQINYNTLEKVYKEPKPDFVVNLQDLMDEHLMELKKQGRISWVGNSIKFLK